MDNNDKCKIVSKGNVGNNTFTLIDVLYVENLHNNLISISQLCDKGMIIFYSDLCKIIDKSSKEILFSGKRKGNIYSLSFDDLTLSKCLVAKDIEVNL